MWARDMVRVRCTLCKQYEYSGMKYCLRGVSGEIKTCGTIGCIGVVGIPAGRPGCINN